MIPNERARVLAACTHTHTHRIVTSNVTPFAERARVSYEPVPCDEYRMRDYTVALCPLGACDGGWDNAKMTSHNYISPSFAHLFIL